MRIVRIAMAATAIGAVVGVLTFALSVSVDAAFSLFQQGRWLAFALPLAGVATVAWYRRLRVSLDESTSSVIEAARRSKPVPATLAPAIFVGTCLTVMCGGSVGKEAAALQMGGSVASSLGDRFGPRQAGYRETFVLCGLAAALSAVLHTPIAALLFAAEVVRQRFRHPLRLAAVALSSLVAFLVTCLLPAVGWAMPTPGSLVGDDVDLVVVAILGVAAAVVGGAFCLSLKTLRRLLRRLPLSDFARVAFGGALIAALVYGAGMDSYSGTGMGQIAAALSGEPVASVAFLGKLVLTALTLSFGFKGGEVMPVLCIGACLGSAIGAAMHVDPACMAALGMVALFSACSNCPLASCVLGLELFGVGMGLDCAVVAAIAFALSYRCSLYQSARIEWTPREAIRRMRERRRREASESDEPPTRGA